MDTTAKGILQSRTVISAIAGLCFSIADAAGVKLPGDAYAWTDTVILLGEAVGFVGAIFFRIIAKQPVNSKELMS